MIDLILLWFEAFFLTLVLEIPIIGVLLRKEEPSRARLVALAFFANLSSHPLVWFVVPAVVHPPLAAFLTSELLAWLLEASFFRLAVFRLSWSKACLTSAIANAVSALVGWLLFQFAGPWLSN